MNKAVIFFTNGTTHKLSMPHVTIEEFTRIIRDDIKGYPELTLDHVAQWIERL